MIVLYSRCLGPTNVDALVCEYDLARTPFHGLGNYCRCMHPDARYNPDVLQIYESLYCGDEN
jgi:hypothetical protein